MSEADGEPSPSRRDQGTTPFTSILDELCKTTGATSAVLVDAEGESVDYSGQGDPFEIRVLAAEWRLIQQHAEMGQHLAGVCDFLVTARKKTFALEVLPEGYALVVELPRGAPELSDRAISQALLDICEEAGFELNSHRRGLWRRVVVEEEAETQRPSLLSITPEPPQIGLDVIGRLAAPGQSGDRESEQGYRVRLSSGEERTLIREEKGRWYIAEDD